MTSEARQRIEARIALLEADGAGASLDEAASLRAALEHDARVEQLRQQAIVNISKAKKR